MKLPERLARRNGRGYHSAFATSFAIEFAALEEVMLPQLSAGGANNVLLIADARMTTMALSDGSALPQRLGQDYVVYSPPAADGIFHPKIILQVGREGGRCIISSANVTGAGLGGNVEVAVEVECGSEPSAEREIIRSTWRYINALVPSDSGAARESFNWARERARWLDEPGESAELQILDDGTAMALLARPGGEAIGARFAAMIGNETVERLIVLSPYWDHDLSALAALEVALAPERTSILLDVNRHEFPVAAPMPPNREFIDISQWRSNRFTHAKILIAVTADHDHVLSGSANCTVAALGDGSFAGTNAEACIYRRLPHGSAISALVLEGWLASEPLPISSLPPPAEKAPIPLDEMHVGAAGSFETEGGRLLWRRPAGRWKEGTVLLNGVSGDVIAEADIAKFTVDEERLSLWMGETTLEGAAFAQVHSGADISLRTFITHRSVLRSRRREAASGSVAKALSVFDDGSDLDLYVHQAFEELCRMDVDEEESVSKARLASQGKAAEERVQDIRFLTYEEFMAARSTRRAPSGRNDSTVAGTHFDSVRALLNRLSGVTRSAQNEAGSDADDDWMNLGDETGELEEKVTPQQSVDEVAMFERPSPDMRAYDRAVKAYIENLNSVERALGPRDVLRLRLWIVLILREARCDAAPRGMPATADDKGWPRLIVRIVSAFFWGKRSPLSRLIISNEYDEMPVDFMECWTTVLWALDAIVAAVPDQPRTRDFLRRIPVLKAHVVANLSLTPADLETELMKSRRMALDTEIGIRLGIVMPGQ